MYRSLILQKLLFFCIDCIFIVASFAAAFYVRLGSFYSTDFPFEPYLENALLITPLWLLFLTWGGRYKLKEQSFSEILRSISLGSLAGAMLFVLIFFFRREIFFSRAIVFLIFTFGMLGGVLSYFLEKNLEKWKVSQGKDVHNTLVIGANRAAKAIIRRLIKSKSRHQPVAIIAPFGSSQKEISGIPIVGKLDALEKTVEKYEIREIILCDGSEQMLNLLSFAEGRFLDFRVSPEILGVFRENIAPEVLAGKPVLTLESSPLFGWGQLWKRLFDVVVSIVPLFLLCVIWSFQKVLYGLQPIFIKEERIGAAGRKFQMFRSAFGRKDSPWRDAPNVINILRGEMSFVGPRPALREEWEKMPAHFKRRMILRPGMLGVWQLKKLRGECDDFEAMCKDDLQYIHHWSFWEDMKIIWLSKWQIFKNLWK